MGLHTAVCLSGMFKEMMIKLKAKSKIFFLPHYLLSTGLKGKKVYYNN